MLSKLFNHFSHVKQPPSFDIEKAVGHYLLTLPRCTSRVAVVSRRYLDKLYNFELTVDTASLAPWSEEHAKGVVSSNAPEQAARLALPLWLRLADLSDVTETLLPKDFFEICREYHGTFLEIPSSHVHCYECGKNVDGVMQSETQLQSKEIFEVSGFEWRCPEGHLLYAEEIGLHSHVSGIEIPSFLRKK